MFTFKLVPNLSESAIDHELRGIGGDVYRWLKRKGYEMEMGAVHEVLPHFKTGRLAQSIYSDVERVPVGLKLIVGARAGHALVHHQGSRPHAIPIIRSPNPRVVHHPGTRANPFLTNQLKLLRTP